MKTYNADKKKVSGLKLVLGGLLGLVLLMLVVAYFFINNKVNTEITKMATNLIDKGRNELKSNAFTPEQKTELSAVFDDLNKSLAAGDFELNVIGATPEFKDLARVVEVLDRNLKPTFSALKIEDGDEKTPGHQIRRGLAAFKSGQIQLAHFVQIGGKALLEPAIFVPLFAWKPINHSTLKPEQQGHLYDQVYLYAAGVLDGKVPEDEAKALLEKFTDQVKNTRLPEDNLRQLKIYYEDADLLALDKTLTEAVSQYGLERSLDSKDQAKALKGIIDGALEN